MLESLCCSHKEVSNPKADWKNKPGHAQRNYSAKDDDGRMYRIYLRKNDYDNRDFSCGIAIYKPDGTPLTLARYNGSSHKHGEIDHQCHIHKASRKAIAQGRKPEYYAEATDRYDSLTKALICLLRDFNVRGVTAQEELL